MRVPLNGDKLWESREGWLQAPELSSSRMPPCDSMRIIVSAADV